MAVIWRRHEGWPTVPRLGRRVLAGLIGLMLIAGCGDGRPAGSLSQTPEAFAQQVLALLNRQDIEAVARMVDPVAGVRFSPYGTVDAPSDVRLSGEALRQAWAQNRRFTWGVYDGSGEPIEKAIRDYFAEFVLDADFASAPKTAVNQIIGRGNSVINLDTAYAGATFVEFHFPGFDPALQGMDWKSLRLILKPRREGGWWLVGVVHDGWTI